MNTIKLTDKQLEEVQRAMLRSTIRDIEHVGDEMRRLEEVAPWPANLRSSDTRCAVSLLRESLDILDAIGWPRDETRGEWEARMAAATKAAETP